MNESKKLNSLKTKQILFVCLGNICRSPAAEAVFRRVVDEAGLADVLTVDSAGLIDYHEGELADPRMRVQASRRGYDLVHRSRPVTSDDFVRFDWIVGMDRQNMSRLRRLSPENSAKLMLLSDFLTQHDAPAIPDPYYGDEKDFIHVLDLLDDACRGLLDYLMPYLAGAEE